MRRWKTHSQHMENDRPFPHPTNRFPTAPPEQAVYAHSHNACGCENPSYPFLSGMEQTEKNPKKSGSTAIGRKLYSHCIYLYELFTLFSSSSGVGTTGGNASTSFRSASRLNNAINCSTNVSISSWCSLHQNANKIFWSPRAVSA